jgi:hypothetical protein
VVTLFPSAFPAREIIMSRYLALAVVLLATGAARTQEAPERLLPASTQVYLRWDGIEAHRASYEKTALGKMLQEDTGKFLAGVYHQLQTMIGEELTVPNLLEGLDPDKLRVIQEDVTEAPRLVPVFTRNGFVLAAEVRDKERFQVTLILPGAGADPKPFLSAMRLIAGATKVEVKETKLADGVIRHLSNEPIHVVWWVEGGDAVLVVGTDKLEAVVERARQKTDRLADNAQFQKIRDFKGFETAVRGYIDTAALVKLARAQGKEVAKIVDDLGLGGLQGIRLYLGFDVPAERSLIEIDMPGPRKGLLTFANSKPFQFSELPSLPDDVINFTALRLNPAGIYDTGARTAESVAGSFSPLAVPLVYAALAKADSTVGIAIRKDLLAELGDTLVVYNSATDGQINLGTTLLLKVKDEKKVSDSLEKLVKALAGLSGAEVKVRKRSYRSAALHELYVKQQGFIFVPTYAVHKGWLAISFYPQPVQGFVLRSNGEVPAWKAPPEVEASLAKMPKDFLAVSVSDPRPTLRQVLSLVPLISGSYRAFMPETKFDVGALPNGHQATRHLFPNVMVTHDDGTTLRIQSRSSLQLPFDLVGVDSYFSGIFLLLVTRIG